MQISSALLESDFPMPHKPRKGVPFFEEEEEEEAYCAAPFNMNAPDVEAPLPTSFTEDGEEITGTRLWFVLLTIKQQQPCVDGLPYLSCISVIMQFSSCSVGCNSSL